MDIEFRDNSNYPECRIEASDMRRLRGYAIVFNSRSQNLGGFQEIIAPDAIDRTLKEGVDLRALVGHDGDKVLGRLRAGTMEVQKDARGLRVMIEPDMEISYARDIQRAVARGDVSGMSFGFRVMPGGDEWDEDESGMPIRTVTDMRVSEVSIVTFPAYTATDVNVAQRSLREFQQTQMGSKIAWLEKIHRQRLAS